MLCMLEATLFTPHRVKSHDTGPMIHMGAIVGSGLSQGRSKSIGFRTNFFKVYCSFENRFYTIQYHTIPYNTIHVFSDFGMFETAETLLRLELLQVGIDMLWVLLLLAHVCIPYRCMPLTPWDRRGSCIPGASRGAAVHNGGSCVVLECASWVDGLLCGMV